MRIANVNNPPKLVFFYFSSWVIPPQIEVLFFNKLTRRWEWIIKTGLPFTFILCQVCCLQYSQDIVLIVITDFISPRRWFLFVLWYAIQVSWSISWSRNSNICLLDYTFFYLNSYMPLYQMTENVKEKYKLVALKIRYIGNCF